MNADETQALIQTAEDHDPTYLGYWTDPTYGSEEDVSVADQYRVLHTLTLGPIGYGKTQVAIHAALQDAAKGCGFCMVNPKGSAIDQLLAKLPEDRLEDVVYLNPADEPVPAINILEPHITEDTTASQAEHQKEIIVSNVIDLFKRQNEGQWGSRFGRVLENLLRALIEINIRDGTSKTLIDAFDAVRNQNRLTELIDSTDDSFVREQLVSVKQDLTDRDLEPLKRRIGDFTSNAVVRQMIGASESAVNFREAVDDGKILLVDVQKGEVGRIVAQLTGTIVITQLWAAVQNRINQPPEDRTPYYLYVDELNNFAGEDSNFDDILSESREYGLGCWVITQYLNQLPTKMQQAVLNNCRTKIIFDPSASEDFNQITRVMKGVQKPDLAALEKYRAAVQMPGEREQRSAVIVDTYPPWTGERDEAEVNRVKSERTPASKQTDIEIDVDTGAGGAAGGEKHDELLSKAQNVLKDREDVARVSVGYQDGSSKPDGTVIFENGEKANLEAEHSTLSKPAKVLENYLRAAEQDREVFFVVKQAETGKLESIVSDPVNRHGDSYEDEHGGFDYYRGEDGREFTELDELEETGFQVLGLTLESDCPEIGSYGREELVEFCMHRDEDGHCDALGQPCVLLNGDRAG